MTAERDALAELVACQDLKDQADYNLLYAQTTGSRELGKKLTEEYRHRKGAAWAAARAVLAAQPDNDQTGDAVGIPASDASANNRSEPSPDPTAAPALLDRLEAASLALHEIATRPNATPGELQTSAYEAYDAARAGK